MDDRGFMIALYDHDFGAILGPVELPAFAEWLKTTLLDAPGFMFGFELGNGKRGYAHFEFVKARGAKEEHAMFEMSMPTLYLPQLGMPTFPQALEDLPCWHLGHGDTFARRLPMATARGAKASE